MRALASLALVGLFALPTATAWQAAHARPTAPAPTADGPRFDPDAMSARLTEALSLDPATAETVSAILQDAQEAARPHADALREDLPTLVALRRDGGDAGQETRLVRRIADHKAELQLVRFRAVDEIEALLDADQREAFARIRARRALLQRVRPAVEAFRRLTGEDAPLDERVGL